MGLVAVGRMVRHKTQSQWVIDPKCFTKTVFKTEYSSRIADNAPEFVYKRLAPPEKNKSHSLTEGGHPFPPQDQFLTTFKRDYVLTGRAGQTGFKRVEPIKTKAVQVQLGDGKELAVSTTTSHACHREVDMRAANVRNLRKDGLPTAGNPNTIIPPYNIIPGVGGKEVPRFVFDAYEDHTNKFRDTRKFAQMNNPRIPRGHSLNPLTGQVLSVPTAPTVELYPRDPLRPPLNSLGQVRAKTPTSFQLANRTDRKSVV